MHFRFSSCRDFQFASITVILLCAVGGCWNSGHQVAPVSGRVSLNQKPLAGVHVSFQPSGAGQAGTGSVGITDEQGRFQLKIIGSEELGAVVGQHIVRLTAKELQQKGKDDAPPVRKNPLPPQSLNGSLNFEVTPAGTDQANFDLKF